MALQALPLTTGPAIRLLRLVFCDVEQWKPVDDDVWPERQLARRHIIGTVAAAGVLVGGIAALMLAMPDYDDPPDPRRTPAAGPSSLSQNMRQGASVRPVEGGEHGGAQLPASPRSLLTLEPWASVVPITPETRPTRSPGPPTGFTPPPGG